MTHIVLAGLLLGLAAAPAAVDHMVRVDHHSGPVDAIYRGQVTISYRQVGAVAPPGVPSTLRCRWAAHVAVERAARSASGVATRSIASPDVLTGVRPGWCDAHRDAVAGEVAARMDDVRARVERVAQEDHEVLRSELDRLATRTRAG